MGTVLVHTHPAHHCRRMKFSPSGRAGTPGPTLAILIILFLRQLHRMDGEKLISDATPVNGYETIPSATLR
jgi:hypothetical protein